ncbi:MAG: MYG1 family protein [Candidatus Zambryskibacteria bacterium]|nr:MYG1 family protein [Candidatus Zambryskibacteria bacterium]
MEENKKIKIVTHSSKFHVDDVFAVAALFLLLEKNHEITVLRSRDPNIHATGDYVIDTGDVYDPDRNRFDHHQRGGAGGRPNGILYSSFGLVWKKFGMALCGDREVSQKIDKMLVEPIDANDNGINIFQPVIKDVYPFDIRSLFYIFRPTWKEEVNIDVLFMEVVSYAKAIITRAIITITDQKEAERLVVEAYEKAEDKRLIILDERYPWEEVLLRFPEPLFVTYKKRVDNDWTLKTIRENVLSYDGARKDLPQAWAGLRDEKLEKVTGVPGSVFCHNGRFIAVAKTKEAILKLANLALKD